MRIVLGRSECTPGYPTRRGVLSTESFASLYIPCWTDASRTSRATISGGSYFNVLTVRLSDICLFVADSFHWTGHYRVWVSDVHHRDVSAFNLMYKRREDGAIVGVLIDFDLAILRGGQSTNTERTRTMPFTALDILSSIAGDTHQSHLYRHDAESFLWVAIWVCGTYEGGKERQDAPFKAWTQGDARHCLSLKLYFLSRGESKLWSKSHQARVYVLRGIRGQMDDDDFKRRKQRRSIEASGGAVPLEVPDPHTDYTDYKRIDDLFSTLRQELVEY